VALTRAKAWVLRDALGVDLVAVEERSEEGGVAFASRKICSKTWSGTPCRSLW
jgi:hypothetical protein